LLGSSAFFFFFSFSFPALQLHQPYALMGANFVWRKGGEFVWNDCYGVRRVPFSQRNKTDSKLYYLLEHLCMGILSLIQFK
jgi:hypothetical protein